MSSQRRNPASPGAKPGGWRGANPAVALGALLLGLATATATAVTGAEPAISFNRDIRPILSDNCFACHGPDKNTRKAKLRLDTSDGATATSEGKAAIVPGKPEASELLRRLTTSDVDDLMPPLKTGKKLTTAQIDLLRTWIAQGAKYEGHWAFQPLVRPATPTVKQADWPLNPVDNFILDRLEREGLAPSPEADRRTLTRRACLDLTGLPPKPAEIERLVKSTSPGWYEDYVTSLLRSPHYGERMAAPWLDLARYADTVGFHGDNEYSAWPYRDYVIGAYNDNIPFDRFTREQLAGDILPEATARTRVASGFNRLNRMSTEGGIQDKEYLAKYAADRVRTVSSIWMGATVGCAECHDHKFDPFTTKDFYRMEAFFADLNEKGYYPAGYGKGDWGPRASLPVDEQLARLGQLDREIAETSTALALVSDQSLARARESWAATVRTAAQAGTLAWTNAKPATVSSANGATLKIKDDRGILVSGELPDDETYTTVLPVSTGKVAALRLEVLDDDSLAGNRIGRAGQGFYLSALEVELVKGSQSTPVRVNSIKADNTLPGYPGGALVDGRPDTAWGSGGGRSSVVLRFGQTVEGGKDVSLRVTLRHLASKPKQHAGLFRFAFSSFADADFDNSGLPKNLIETAKLPAAKRTPAQATSLAAYYRKVAPKLTELNTRLAALTAERDVIGGRVPTVLVSEKRAPRTMRVLPRGNWMDDSGEEVQPGVPPLFGAFKPASERATRLDLANWLVSPENPLTARAFVNRLWRLYFGTGLSKNLDDLGAQGEWPTHPELLDWLASEFRESGWDVKRLVRLIVTSRTYRQTSVSNSSLDERDPFNRLLGHQNRFRLDAELVRDNALAIAGLLVDQVGGPSIRPYQPEGYYASLNFPKREYVSSIGEDLYRRGVYVHWQRTFLHPEMLAFDAPGREECTANRVNSNTPLQALVLLNDPVYVEIARVFAQNIIRHGGTGAEDRINWAFNQAVGRNARPEERRLLVELQGKQRALYEKDPKAATALLAVGEAPLPSGLAPAELASWTAVARSVLNLHETITRN